MKPLSLINTIFSTIMAIILFTLMRLIRFEHLFNYQNFSIVIAILIVYLCHELYWKRRYLPPGPIPWLLAGNMPHVIWHHSNIDALFLKWKQEFGGIFTFWMGPIPMVMVADVETMRKYFVKNGEFFTGRWQNFITDTFMDGQNGIVQVEGEKWREQRRFSLHMLRDFGLGRALMEEKIWTEVEKLIKHLKTHLNGDCLKPKPINLTKPMGVCIANIINNILFGKTFSHDNLNFLNTQEMLDEQSSLVVKPIMGLYITLPWAVQIPLINWEWLHLMDIRNSLWAFLEKQLQEHRVGFHAKISPTDFTYAYMLEMHNRRLNSESMGHFSELQLKMLLLDLFFAGSETTTTTTKWGLLMLILNPEVQEKCHAELAKYLAPGERVYLKNKSQMVYLQATIFEIQRVANILPINLLRTCTETIELDGFRFEAGTMVLPQISIVLNDPENFPKPEEFQPERFIEYVASDENDTIISDNDKSHCGKTAKLRRYDAFLPFSLGKRQCLGEALARAELFLIFANLLNNFTFQSTVSIDGKLPKTKRLYGLTVSPPSFEILLENRLNGNGMENLKNG